MKCYEYVSRIYLTRRVPVIIRLDGKAFHSFTKGFQKPFDEVLIKTMQETAKYLCKNIMGCKLAYTQSDEISLLLEDYERAETQPWFENNLQKIVSVSASMATMAFNKFFHENRIDYLDDKNSVDWIPCGYGKHFALMQIEWQNKKYEAAESAGAMFDARAFIIPKEEVCNYFIWRQQDASHNSIQMVAQSLFSHKQLQNKNCDQLQEMMFQEHNINWNDYPTAFKRGSACYRVCEEAEVVNIATGEKKTTTRSHWVVDENIPIFTQDREFVERWIDFE